MDRYRSAFTRLIESNEGAFVPYVTLGDPNLEVSLKIVETIIEAGADALELGIPFSDPLADGPVIQGASLRALKAGTTPDLCFKVISEVRSNHPELPIGLLLYANLVFSNGIDNFYQKCAAAGVDSVLIGDVPVEESYEFRTSASKNGIHTIFFAPPNADDSTLRSVSAFGGGYTYLLSRAGVTSVETRALMPSSEIIEALKSYNAPPPLLGFGISEPEQVREALRAGAAGAISGSAIVKIIESNFSEPEIMFAKLHDFVHAMKAATKCHSE